MISRSSAPARMLFSSDESQQYLSDGCTLNKAIVICNSFKWFTECSVDRFCNNVQSKIHLFLWKIHNGAKTHSSFERNKVFLKMKNRKMLKTCFEMKHKYRETWWKEQQKFNYKFSNFPTLYNTFVPKTILVVTFIK